MPYLLSDVLINKTDELVFVMNNDYYYHL